MDRTDPRLTAEPALNAEMADATEPTDRIDPAEPIERIDPAEPIERMDPAEPMDRIDPADPMLSSEPAPSAGRRESALRIWPFSQPGMARRRPYRGGHAAR